MMYFVFAEILVKPISCFTRSEKINKNKMIPNFTNRVVDNQPTFSEMISLTFQKIPKKKAPNTASLTPAESWNLWFPISLQFKDAKVAPKMIVETPKVCKTESRCPININANNMVNTAHRFMVAAIIDTLPISKPLKKNKYPAE